MSSEDPVVVTDRSIIIIIIIINNVHIYSWMMVKLIKDGLRHQYLSSPLSSVVMGNGWKPATDAAGIEGEHKAITCGGESQRMSSKLMECLPCIYCPCVQDPRAFKRQTEDENYGHKAVAALLPLIPQPESGEPSKTQAHRITPHHS